MDECMKMRRKARFPLSCDVLTELGSGTPGSRQRPEQLPAMQRNRTQRWQDEPTMELRWQVFVRVYLLLTQGGSGVVDIEELVGQHEGNYLEGGHLTVWVQ